MSVRHGIDVKATLYTPSGSFPFKYKVSDADFRHMGTALGEAKKAVAAGDSPVGSVLVHPEYGIFPAHTTEFSEHDLQGHAEQNSYKLARERVGLDLGECALYTTAELCYSCAYLYDKGGLGMLFIAAMRSDAPDFFRRGNVVDDVFSRTRRNLTVISGLRKVEALELLVLENRKHS